INAFLHPPASTRVCVPASSSARPCGDYDQASSRRCGGAAIAAGRDRGRELEAGGGKQASSKSPWIAPPIANAGERRKIDPPKGNAREEAAGKPHTKLSWK